MKTQIFKTAFLLTVLLFFNCSDTDDPQDQLPPITQTGENTFGAIVDGKVFIPKDNNPSVPGGGVIKGIQISSGDGIEFKNYYAITTRNYHNANIYMYIYIPKDRPQQKIYTFNSSPGVESSLEHPDFSHVFCYINDNKYISYENSGAINFQKVDFNQEICAGVFSVKLKNESNENDIIEISNGQFDLICTEPIGD